ncbi:MAG: hypothetical protein Q9169_008523, partial [Polycauliona sp. 2 TL-2023]
AKLSKNNKGWGTSTPMGGGAGGGGMGTASSFRGFGQSGNASSFGLRSSGVGAGGGAQTSGTASSIAFTPVQGLELVDPKVRGELKRKREEENDRWFKGGTFTQVGGAGSGKVDAGGFKVPALPAGRKG